MIRTAAQNNRIWALVAQAGLSKDDVAALVYQVTNGRTSRSSEMEVREADMLIDNLQQKVGSKAKDTLDTMRKKIISMAREMNWEKNGRADMQRIYAWVLKYSPFHKPLNDHNQAELAALVTQFERGPYATWLQSQS